VTTMTRAPETRAPVAFCDPAARKWVLLVAILASSLGFIDASVTSIALPAIRASLGASLAQAQWIGNAYLLVLASLILAGGALGDRFGTVRIFSAGIAVFILASVFCALAPSAEALIAARALKGFGAALMVPGSMAIIGKAYPRGERGRAIGLWSAASAITMAIGPVLGGVLLSLGPDWAWRVIFAINLPLGALSMWLLFAHVRPDAGRQGVSVDLVGAVLATAGLGMMAYALTSPGPQSWLFGLTGLGTFIAFVLWQARAAAPMMRLTLFRDLGFASANATTFFLYFALTAVSFCLPMTAISAWGVGAAAVTAAFLPFSIIIGVMSGPTGRLADRIGPAPLVAAGALLVALAYLVLAVFAHRAAFWGVAVPCMIVAAIGMGLVVAPLSAGVLASVGDDEQGAASGINNAVARVASLVAVALGGTVAAWGYAVAGGTVSFADADAAGAGHITATSAGFAWVAGLAAFCAALSAIITVAGVRQSRS
jgi:EmrB/QacA subfamily drug resistance transporter